MDQPLAEQQAAHQVQVVARRAHGDQQAAGTEPHLQRFLDDDGVVIARRGVGAGARTDPHHRYASVGVVGHRLPFPVTRCTVTSAL
jgi:hypothetical protein